MIVKTDWEGLPIPENEPPDQEVLAWEIEPHPNREYDLLVDRSWHNVRDYFLVQLEEMLERFVADHTREELLREEFVVRFRVRSYRLEDLPESD